MADVDFSKIHNEFLHLYHAYTDNTESPDMFHCWSGLSALSACLGKRVWLPHGIHKIYSNMYIVLSGPPGVRKSTAISWATHRLKNATNIAWAPDDTGGQRQGLIKALSQTKEQPDSETGKKTAAIAGAQSNPIELQKMLDGLSFDYPLREPEVLYGAFQELDSALGTSQRDLLTFFRIIWDSSRYTYQLRNEIIVLEEPVLSFISATTPENLAGCLPEGSFSSGFCSRVIFVYSDTKKARLPDPPPPDESLVRQVETVFSYAHTKLHGAVKVEKQAKTFIDELYMHSIDNVEDARFIHYLQRRQTHLIKTMITLAAGRQDRIITIQDALDAHYLLSVTEIDMPMALGEFGLSPTARAQQKILDCLRAKSNGVMKDLSVWAQLQRDVKLAEYKSAIDNLVNAGKIKKRKVKIGGIDTLIYIAVRKESEVIDAIYQRHRIQTETEKQQIATSTTKEVIG